MDKVLKSQKVQSVRQLQGDGSPRKNLTSSKLLASLKSKDEIAPESGSPVG